MKKQITKTHALTPDPSNPNRLDPADKKRMARSLDEFGDLSGVILNRRTGLLVGGHQRVDVLAGAEVQAEDLPAPEPDGTVARGWLVKSGKRYALRVVDWDETKAHAALLAANRFGRIGKDDDAALRALLDGLEAEGFDLELAGYTAEALAEAGLRDEPEGEADAEAQIDRAEELNQTWCVKPGDLWLVGEHRLLCGDSTNAEDVARLMGGETGEIVFTSPPYNAGNTSTGGYGGNPNRAAKGMYNSDFDSMSKAQYFDFLVAVLGCLAGVVGDSAPVLWNVAYNAKSRDDYGRIVFSPSNPFTVKETIIWDKGLGMNVAARGILSRTGELIFLMSKGDDYTTNQGPKDTYWNLWRISNRDGDNMGNSHGASFPVALPTEGLKLFSSPGALCVDPFLGSGTTMVAAQNLGRKCFGLEISPAYCAVILQRMADAFPGIDIRKAD